MDMLASDRSWWTETTLPPQWAMMSRHLLQLAGLVGQGEGEADVPAAGDEAAGDDTAQNIHVDVAAGDDADDLLALDGELVEDGRLPRPQPPRPRR